MKESPPATVVAKRAYVVTFMGALLVCLVAVLWMVWPYLLSLYLGGTMAMLAYPVYKWLGRKKFGPRLAAATVTVLLLVLVIAPLTGFAILTVKQGVVIGQDLAKTNKFSTETLSSSLSRWRVVGIVIGNPEEVNARMNSAMRTTSEFIVARVLELGKGSPEFLLQLVLSMIAFFFFLLDGARFVDWVLRLSAMERNVQTQLVESFRDTTISTVLAGLAAAASQAVLITIAFLLLSVPGAFLAGGLTFIFAWIPLLGTVPTVLAGALYLFIQGAPVKLAIMIILGLAAGVLDNLVRSVVLQGRDDMHPLVGFVAIIGGIQMFGILGVFIGPLLAAMLLSLLKVWPVIQDRIGMGPA